MFCRRQHGTIVSASGREGGGSTADSIASRFQSTSRIISAKKPHTSAAAAAGGEYRACVPAPAPAGRGSGPAPNPPRACRCPGVRGKRHRCSGHGLSPPPPPPPMTDPTRPAPFFYYSTATPTHMPPTLSSLALSTTSSSYLTTSATKLATTSYRSIGYRPIATRAASCQSCCSAS